MARQAVAPWLLLVVLAGAAPARAELVVASRQADTLHVVRIGPSAITPLFTVTAPDLHAYAWSNAHTLWLVRGNGAGRVAEQLIDGKVVTTVALADLAIAVPGRDVPSGVEVGPGLVVARSGQVFVSACAGPAPGRAGQAGGCTRSFIRIDDGSRRRVRTPGRVRFDSDAAAPSLGDRAVAPPRGYAATRTVVTIGDARYPGVRCAGPAGQDLAWPAATWTDRDGLGDPRFVPAPRSLTWLAARPALLRIRAAGTSPVGERLRQDVYLLDCRRRVDDVRRLGQEVWLIDGEIHSAGALLGALPGQAPAIAP